MKWEYLVTILATDAMNHFLNQYGKDRWELVAVVPASALQHTLYFKRQAKGGFLDHVPVAGPHE